ncbi:DUF5060 domain-containing protein [Microbacterium sp. X-17]|uniref:DUF5060 domain-containing protein n=1 Tax=Microbacterium sp. X-17 TaxID=3144404 RepID=UPI0031F59DD8
MATADRQTRVSEILDDERGRSALRVALPQLFELPESADTVRTMVIGTLMDYARLDTAASSALLAELAHVEVSGTVEQPPITPDPGYESADVPEGTARLDAPATTQQWETFDLRLTGPAHGNPYVDVDVWADFSDDDGVIRVGGFYDGDGQYRIRFLPTRPGTWSFTTGSTARSLNAIVGSVHVDAGSAPGPVRADGTHFTYADGRPFVPIGTTLYAWTHQEEEHERETLVSLAASPFTKVRMCVFPKHYNLTRSEPPRFPFPHDDDGEWDTTRFDPEFFRHLESRIIDLAQLGIQADVILFHPYDRWGFQSMGTAADDRYTRYLVRRLAGFANVWWSLANEYDLMPDKRDHDWHRIARVIQSEDHASHLLSIHNGTRIFDHGAEWATHCSIQKIDADSPVAHVETWLSQWRKPVVVDEFGYEGDVDFEWGSLTAEEVVRRFWGIMIRGAYATHGETYLNDQSRLWWATGGTLAGESPRRVAFLAGLVNECPSGRLDPLSGLSHIKRAGIAGEYELVTFSHFQPKSYTFTWPEGVPAIVDFIDPWAMTIQQQPGQHSGTFSMELPRQSDLVVRVRRHE